MATWLAPSNTRPRVASGGSFSQNVGGSGVPVASPLAVVELSAELVGSGSVTLEGLEAEEVGDEGEEADDVDTAVLLSVVPSSGIPPS